MNNHSSINRRNPSFLLSSNSLRAVHSRNRQQRMERGERGTQSWSMARTYRCFPPAHETYAHRRRPRSCHHPFFISTWLLALEKHILLFAWPLRLKSNGILNFNTVPLTLRMRLLRFPPLLSFLQFGRTEVIDNTLNPDFVRKFIVDYFFEERQNLRFDLWVSLTCGCVFAGCCLDKLKYSCSAQKECTVSLLPLQ